MGTPEFAVPSLLTLCRNNYKPIAVVTGADKPRGRGQTLSPTPIKITAIDQNISNIFQPEDLKSDQFYHQMKSLEADLFIIVAFRILPQRIFMLPKLGSFNLHSSLLPRYRGAAPIQWAILNGDTESGVTTFFLQPSVDTGNLILQEKVDILPDMTGSQLHDKLSEIGAHLVLKTVKRIESANLTTIKQDDRLVTQASKIKKEDTVINWNESGEKIKNKIRAFDSYPGAMTTLNGKSVKLFSAQFSEEKPNNNLTNGTIIKVEKSAVTVKVSDGKLTIGEMQVEGKKRMKIFDLINGFSIKENDFFK